MKKREKLTAELNRKERILREIQAAEQCTCICHRPGIDILHVESCCIRYGFNPDQLQKEIQELKRKLIL